MEPGLLARLGRWTYANAAGHVSLPLTAGKDMMQTRSCEYNVQNTIDDEPRPCGHTGVKRATTSKLDIVYCQKHFKTAEKRLGEYKATIEDYDGSK